MPLPSAASSANAADAVNRHHEAAAAQVDLRNIVESSVIGCVLHRASERTFGPALSPERRCRARRPSTRYHPDEKRIPFYRLIRVTPIFGSFGTNCPAAAVGPNAVPSGIVSQKPSAKGSPVSGSLFLIPAKGTLQLILRVAPSITGPSSGVRSTRRSTKPG